MNNILKISIVSITITSLMIGCAGRTANPVPTWQPDDDTMSCTSLISNMQEMENNIQRLIPKSEKTGKNVALGVTGAFFIVPLFFMDFSEAEKIEIESYRSRYNHLTRLYYDKGCNKKAGGKEVKTMPELFKKDKS